MQENVRKRFMRSALLVLLLCVVSSTAKAQGPSITLGDAVLKLGMTTNEVQTELAKHSPLTLDEKAGTISNGYDETQPDALERYKLYALISFKSGRLSHIEKIWLLNNQDTSAAIASALYGAVSATTGPTEKSCLVYTWTRSEPDQDYKETTIDCLSPGSSRSVHVFIKTFHFSGKDIPDAQISEVLEAR
jgi:hypothetical protein